MIRYIFKNRFRLIILFFFYLSSAISGILLSFCMGNFVNSAMNFNIYDLFKYGIFCIIVLLFICIIDVFECRVRNKYLEHIIICLKRDIYDSIFNANNENLFKYSSSKYINLILNELNILRSDYFENIVLILGYSIKILLGSVVLLFYNYKLFIIMSLISVIHILVVPIFKKRVGIRKKQYVDNSQKQVLFCSEVIKGLDGIRINLSEHKFFNNIMKIEEDFEHSRYCTINNDQSIIAIIKFLGMSTQIFCMLVAAFFVAIGEISVGGIVMSTQILNYIFPSLNLLHSKVIIIKGVKYIFEDINNILNFNSKDVKLKNIPFSTIKFENVSVEMNKRILKSFNVEMNKGEKIAIVGESGSGKSTLCKILMQLVDYNGHILIDEIELKDISYNEVYKNIAYAPQKPFIYTSTLEENISMFQEYDEKYMEYLIKTLNLTSLSKKIINNDNVSGGEASRIAIARTLIRRFNVVIYDEPTSAVDPINSKMINDLIFGIENKIVIVITHNWDKNYLDKFDKIIKI